MQCLDCMHDQPHLGFRDGRVEPIEDRWERMIAGTPWVASCTVTVDADEVETCSGPEAGDALCYAAFGDHGTREFFTHVRFHKHEDDNTIVVHLLVELYARSAGGGDRGARGGRPRRPRDHLAGRGVAAARRDRRRPPLSIRRAARASSLRTTTVRRSWSTVTRDGPPGFHRTPPGARSVPSACWPRSPSSSRSPRSPRRRSSTTPGAGRHASCSRCSRPCRSCSRGARRWPACSPSTALPPRGAPRRPPAQQLPRGGLPLPSPGSSSSGCARRRRTSPSGRRRGGLLTATAISRARTPARAASSGWRSSRSGSRRSPAACCARATRSTTSLDEQAREIESNRTARERRRSSASAPGSRASCTTSSPTTSRSCSSRPRPPSAPCRPTPSARGPRSPRSRTPAARRSGSCGGCSASCGAATRSSRWHRSPRWSGSARSCSAWARPGCRSSSRWPATRPPAARRRRRRLPHRPGGARQRHAPRGRHARARARRLRAHAVELVVSDDGAGGARSGRPRAHQPARARRALRRRGPRRPPAPARLRAACAAPARGGPGVTLPRLPRRDLALAVGLGVLVEWSWRCPPRATRRSRRACCSGLVTATALAWRTAAPLAAACAWARRAVTLSIAARCRRTWPRRRSSSRSSASASAPTSNAATRRPGWPWCSRSSSR